MVFRRKVYSKLLEWKKECKGTKAILIEGARRIGECYVIHPRNLAEKDGILCLPPYMTMCL